MEAGSVLVAILRDAGLRPALRMTAVVAAPPSAGALKYDPGRAGDLTGVLLAMYFVLQSTLSNHGGCHGRGRGTRGHRLHPPDDRAGAPHRRSLEPRYAGVGHCHRARL